MALQKAITPVFTDITGATISESENDAERTVVLLNFTSGIDYNADMEVDVGGETTSGHEHEQEQEVQQALQRGFDTEELEETLSDARDLLGKFGAIKKVYLARVGPGDQREDDEKEGGPSLMARTGDAVVAVVPDVCVTFYATSSVLLALSALDGIMLGGQVIRVKMLKQMHVQERVRVRVQEHEKRLLYLTAATPIGTAGPGPGPGTGSGSESQTQAVSTHPSPPLVTHPDKKESEKQGERIQVDIIDSTFNAEMPERNQEFHIIPPPPPPPQFTASGVKLVLENVVCKSDVQGTEELDEVLADIRYLCQAYGATAFSWKHTTMAVHIHHAPLQCLPPVLSSPPAAAVAVASASSSVASLAANVPEGVWGSASRTHKEPGSSTLTVSPELPLTFMWHSDVQTAFAAAQRCQGTVIEGRALSFSFYDYGAYERSRYSLSHCVPFPQNASMSSSGSGSDSDSGSCGSEMFGVQLRGLRWRLQGCEAGLEGACSVDSVMGDVETLLLHCVFSESESGGKGKGDVSGDGQAQREARMLASAYTQYASIKELLYLCNFYHGHSTVAVPSASPSVESSSSSYSGVYQQNLLFLGISFNECVRLQSYLNNLTIDKSRVHSRVGTFKHLQFHAESHSGFNLQADIISTFPSQSTSSSSPSTRSLSPYHKNSSDDRDPNSTSTNYTNNIHDNNHDHNNIFTRIADNRNDHDHLTLTQGPRSTVLPCRVEAPQVIAAAGAGCVLVAQHYLAAEDLPRGGGEEGDSVSVFPEEIKALKIDFLKLMNLYRGNMDTAQSEYCKRVHFVPADELEPLTPPPHTQDHRHQQQQQQQLVEDSDKYDVAISFKRISEAIEVMLTLDEIVLGGQKVKALLSEDRCTSDNVIFSFTPGKLPATIQDSTLVAPAVGKLPVHIAPASTELPVASDEINRVTKELLNKLATFQQRAKETDPLNAKKKERLVMGIKQVA